MNFVAAFKKLGYELPAHRADWSSASESGVCLSLWSKETDWKALVMDTRQHAEPIEAWCDKPGNTKRVRHAQLALERYDGWIDVVKIEGVPGESYGSAHPWRPEERRGKRWRITFLDPESGHLRLEAQDVSGK